MQFGRESLLFILLWEDTAPRMWARWSHCFQNQEVKNDGCWWAAGFVHFIQSEIQPMEWRCPFSVVFTTMIVGYQDSSATAILQISVEVPVSSRNRFTAWLSYMTLVYIPTGFYILLQRYFFIHVHCFALHNSREWKQSKCPSTYKWIIRCGAHT